MKIRPRASPFGPGAARLAVRPAARRAAPPHLDFAWRLIYTLSLEFSRVANPAEERTLRRDMEGDEQYGARTMTANKTVSAY